MGRPAAGLDQTPQALEEPVPAFAAEVVAGEVRLETDVLEVELGARRAAGGEAEHDVGADPLVGTREARGGDVRDGAVPPHFATGVEAFDAELLVRPPEAEGMGAADGGRDVAVLAPPAPQPFGRGQGGVDRSGRGVEGEVL